MTGNYVFNCAMDLLGYTEDQSITRSAITYVNKVYMELHRMAYPTEKFKPIELLTNEIRLPIAMVLIMPSGIAALIALGRGDGELQQYFALDYDRAKARFNTIDKVHYVI